MFLLRSILFAFLRVSTEMWPRISLFTQTALNQPVPLTGLLFFLIDFKFKQCSDAELGTYSDTAGETPTQIQMARPEEARKHQDTHSTPTVTVA